MSAIFGIYHLDGTSVSPENLNRQMAALDHFGPDANSLWNAGAVGLGHLMTYITPESLDEKLPYHSAESGIAITADARLDNRDELCAVLGIPHQDRAAVLDSHLILSSYTKWGAACPEHLLGDFAFVIWDQDRSTLFCARDHMGIRPFYYHLTSHLFIFASDARGVISHSATPRDLNDKALSILLRDYVFTHRTMTFFETVFQPAVRTMTVVFGDLHVEFRA